MSAHEQFIVRPAEEHDCQDLLGLMQKLAVFEGYNNEFRVTSEALQEKLFLRKEIEALVAAKNNKLIGILVYYQLPFTYDLAPWLFMKELYIEEGYRRSGVGSSLLQALAMICEKRGVAKVRFDVLASNQRARDFYRKFGAVELQDWGLFSLQVSTWLRASKNLHPERKSGSDCTPEGPVLRL